MAISQYVEKITTPIARIVKADRAAEDISTSVTGIGLGKLVNYGIDKFTGGWLRNALKFVGWIFGWGVAGQAMTKGDHRLAKEAVNFGTYCGYEWVKDLFMHHVEIKSSVKEFATGVKEMDKNKIFASMSPSPIKVIVTPVETETEKVEVEKVEVKEVKEVPIEKGKRKLYGV